MHHLSVLPTRRLTALVVALGVAIVVATASATPPGKNGQIAFRRYFDANQTWGAVFTTGVDGKHTRPVSRPPQGSVDDQPEWAPDGSLIAFSRCAPDQLCHVFVVAPDGTGLAPMGALCPAGATEVTCPNDAEASFSPDSRQLAFVQSSGRLKPDPSGDGQWIEHSAIAIANRDGSGRHVIYDAANFSGEISYPVFSPDGTRLVFEFNPSAPAGKHAIFVVGADGSDPRRITPWSEHDGDNPDWSPDGKWIVYHSHLDDPLHQAQIFIVHPDGKGRKQLTHFPAGTYVASSSFAPDGKWIALGKGPDHGNIDVWVMRIDGTHLQRVTRSPLWDSAPDWGPRR